MTELPAGWIQTTLGQIGQYLNGRGFNKSEWRDAGRPIIRIQNLTGSSSTLNYFQGEVEERYVARAGDLLMSWAATLGAYFWNGPEGVVNQHIFKVESKIDPKFHKYLLEHKLGELVRVDRSRRSPLVRKTQCATSRKQALLRILLPEVSIFGQKKAVERFRALDS